MSKYFTREELVALLPEDSATIAVDGVVRPMTNSEWQEFIDSQVGTEKPVPPPDFDNPEEVKRAIRNRLLMESDLKMLPDVPWDTTAWATYRQALRDLPADPAWPDIDFPVAPE